MVMMMMVVMTMMTKSDYRSYMMRGVLSPLISFILLMLVRELPCQRITDPCQFWDDAVYADGKCFKAFTDRWLDWESAQTACWHESSDGRLAEGVSKGQRGAITGNGYNGWIGGKYDPTDGEYKWSRDNETTPLSLAHADSKDCVFSNGANFATDVCTDFKEFICEQIVPNPCDSYLPGAEFYKGSCFLQVDTPLTFHQAQDACEEKGAFLAEPREADVLDFVSKKFPGTKLWLGGHPVEEVGGVIQNVWSTSGLPVDQPIFSTLLSLGKCLHLTLAGAVGQSSCTQQTQFLCQKDIGDPCETDYPGAVFSSGYCFQYILEPHTYEEAKAVCASKNGHVTELETQEIEDFVVDFMMYSMKENHASCDPRGSAPIWIGLTHLTLDSSTRWRTEGHVARGPHRWPAWHDHFGAEDHCAVTTSYGVWEQRACGSRHGFVCQSEISNSTNHRYYVPGKTASLSSSGLDDYYVTVTTAITTHKVYLQAEKHSLTLGSGIPGDSIRKVAIDKETGWHTSINDFAALADVLEIRSTHPVTVTLTVTLASPQGMSSTFVYPTLQDNALWLTGSQVLFVIASPITPPDGYVVENTLTVIAVHAGQTRVSIRGSDGALIGEKGLDANSPHVTTLPHSINGCSVTANQEIAVFFIQEMEDTSGNKSVAIQQLPPLGLLSNEVVSLPSHAHHRMFTDVYTTVASVYSMESYVALPYTMTEEYTTLDPEIAGETYAKYISDGTTSALDVSLVSFNDSSQTSSLYPSANAFVVQSGDEPFYSTQGFVLKSNPRAFCTLSPVPEWLWTHRYAAMLFPGTASVLDIEDTKVVLYLIVHTEVQDAILIGGVVRMLDCAAIEDTPHLSGCTTTLHTSDFQYNQVLNLESSEPFGAYVFLVFKHNALSCSPLGLALPPENFHSGFVELNETNVDLLTTETPTTEPPTTEYITTEVTTDTTEDPCATFYTTDFTTSGTAYTHTSGMTTNDNTNPPRSTIDPATLQCTQPGTIKKSNLTVEETHELVVSIQKALTVEPSNTSMAIRKKTSAQDKRQSSAYIGVLGIVLFSLECALIIIPDAINIYRLFYP